HESGLTVTGAVMGTPAFMAPEQAEGRVKELTTATDVYGLGAIFYFLLTGRPPFEADNIPLLLRKVAEEEPVSPRQFTICELRFTRATPPLFENRKSSIANRIDRDLETICLKCLQKEPAKRYPTARALAEELDRWLRHEPIQARPSTIWELSAKWLRRRPAL